MVFKNLIPLVEKIGINLYDMAFYQDGQIQEHRFQLCNNCNNCYSVAKAFLMTAVGMLQDDGLIDVKKPISFYMSSLIPKDADPAWQVATVENALTHKLGFNTGFLDIDVEDVTAYPTDDYLDMVFRHPLHYLPGQQFQYSDAAFYLVSRLISCVSGENVDVFLKRRLFKPMGFRESAWSCCPRNYPIGATGLYTSAYDMVKLPALYMQKGMWNGERLLSEQWINRAIGNEYELHPRTPELIGKGGMYGQMILFHTEKHYAIAWHAHNTDNEKIQQLIECIDKNI
ncbi:MAG: beta-lactamase family protein [Clostridiales bacterium]|nr:beta-lactamase family protein [Clostridiales bacterium]